MEKTECVRCGNQWFQRKEGRPVRCPKCQSVNWDRLEKYLVDLDCNICKASWTPRKEEYPKCCPRCKSPNWNRTDLNQGYDFHTMQVGDIRGYPFHRMPNSIAPDERKNRNMTRALNSYKKRNPGKEFLVEYINFKMMVKRIL